MSEQNMAIIRELYAADNAHDIERLVRVLDERDYVWESDTHSGAIRTPQQAAGVIATYWKAFPDVQYEIQSMIASGDYVVTRFRATGTHDGEFMGLPPTHRKGEIHGCTVHEVRDGKITRAWSYWDTGHLLRQIGVLPEFGKRTGTS